MRFISNIDEKLAEDIGLALGAAGLITIIAGGVIYGVIPEIRSWALVLMFLGLVSIFGFAFFARDLIASFFQTCWSTSTSSAIPDRRAEFWVCTP